MPSARGLVLENELFRRLPSCAIASVVPKEERLYYTGRLTRPTDFRFVFGYLYYMYGALNTASS